MLLTIPHDASIRRFASALKARQLPLLQSTEQYFEHEDHLSVVLPGLYQGLLYVFDGYRPAAR